MRAELNSELRIANCKSRLTVIRVSLIVALACLLTAACSHSQEQRQASMVEDRFALEEGGRLYQRYCSACHGTEGRGDGRFFASSLAPSPPDLAAAERVRSDKDLVAAITEGSAARGQSDLCPAWGKTLSNTEIGYIVAYVRGFQRKASDVSSEQE